MIFASIYCIAASPQGKWLGERKSAAAGALWMFSKVMQWRDLTFFQQNRASVGRPCCIVNLTVNNC
jgi:hypothetical protein